jgi:hypothetical protein
MSELASVDSMVDTLARRFLQWRLPENENLEQAREMVKFILGIEPEPHPFKTLEKKLQETEEEARRIHNQRVDSQFRMHPL